MKDFLHVLARGSRVRWRGEMWVLHRISRSEAIFRGNSRGVELRLGRRRLVEELRMNTLQLLDPHHEGACGGHVEMGAHITAEAAIVVRVSPPWWHSADARRRLFSDAITPRMHALSYGQRATARRVKRVVERPPALLDQGPLN